MTEMKLTEVEKQTVEAMRGLRKDCKKCILVLRFDGIAWQLFKTTPPVNSKHLEFEHRGY